MKLLCHRQFYIQFLHVNWEGKLRNGTCKWNPMSACSCSPTATFEFDLRSSMQHLPSADLRPSPFPCSFPILSFIIIIASLALLQLLFRFVPLRPSSASDYFLVIFFRFTLGANGAMRAATARTRKFVSSSHRHRVIAHRNRISSSFYIFVRKYL